VNRRLLLLTLLLLAIPALSQTASTTVILLDQSFSMSLPAGQSGTRLSLLLGALEVRINSGSDEERFALIAFEDADEVQVVVPYPATSAAVLSAARDLLPWGTSPILAATRFAVDYSAELPGPTELILVTDGEDNEAFVAGTAYPETTPAQLAGSSIRLTVLTLGGDRPGATGILGSWAAESGGEVIIVEPDGHRRSELSGQRAVLDHETASVTDASESVSLAGTPARSPRTSLIRVLSAWLLVLRWNLALAAILGTVAFVLAVRRWRRRTAAVTRHNAVPTQVVLEVRTSLRRRMHTFSKFPITVGTTAGCSLQLTNGGNDPD